MKRAAIVWMILLAISTYRVVAADSSTTFEGEVSEGQTFRKSIGHGLEFILMPSVDESTGWTIEVSPQGKPSDPECEDFVWVVTPPYHFQNARYLDTEYGITAQEAVHNSPREFNFVLNCTDFETERKRAELAIYPYTENKQAVDDARASLGSSPLGKGRLWIEDSKITPAHPSGDGGDLGAIRWIKFKVEIKFPLPPPSHPKLY